MEFLIIFGLILFNAFLSMSEMAVVSAKKIKLQEWARAEINGSKGALKLAEHPSHFISMIQIYITLIAILNGAYGEERLTHQLQAYFDHYSFFSSHSHIWAMGVVVFCITTISLVIGELIPKNIALHYPERIAIIVATPMRLLTTITYPLVKIFSFFSDLVLKIFNIRREYDPPVSETQIKILMEQGAEAGVFEHEEQEYVKNIFQMDEKKINAIMTRRSDIAYLDIEDNLEDNREKIINSPYSQMLVCKGGIDNILGFVKAKTLLSSILLGNPLDLMAVVQKPSYILESFSVMQVLSHFKENSIQICLVVDEYGGIQGLVTLQDILEVVVGDVEPNEQDKTEEIRFREDGSWLIDGKLTIEKFKELFSLNQLPGEELCQYHTVGGFIMLQLNRIPAVHSRVVFNGLLLEVMEMDGARIARVLVSKLNPVHIG